jgi:hypothetical protein
MDQDFLGKLGIIMNFHEHTVIWDTDTTPMNDRITTSSVETLIEIYKRANQPQTLRHECS